LTVYRQGIERRDQSGSDAFELLLRLSGEGVCLLDSDGRTDRINAAGARLLRSTPEALIGRPFHGLVHAAPSGRATECPLCGPAGDFEGRTTFIRRDGTEFEASCTARTVDLDLGDEGRLILFSPLDNEVAEPAREDSGLDTHVRLRRVVAELAAEKQRTELVHSFARRLFVTPLGDLDGTLVDEFCAMTDSRLGLLYKSDEPDSGLVLTASHGLFRSGVADRIGPDQGSFGAVLSARQPLAEDHSAAPLELAGRTIRHMMHVPLWEGEDDLGVLILARTVARPYSDEEQKSVAHLAGLASTALANAHVVGRLERLSQLARAALDGIVEAIRLVDPEGRELFSNKSMRYLDHELGLDPTESLYGSQSVELARRTTDPEAYLDGLREMQADPEGRTRTEWELEESGRSFERYTAPISDTLGTFIGRLVVLREITAERRAERLQDDLISFASHELRTPLTSVFGFANLLLEEGSDDDAAWRSHVQTIRDEATRLLRMVDELLDFQRIGAGGFALDRTRFDLHDLIEEQISNASRSSRAHEISFESTPRRVAINADRNRIAQVLSNLLSNAIKYSPKGGVVRVRLDAKRNAIRVSIRDSGIGIPESQREKLFTKFFRIESEEVEGIPGLGLGLAFCQEIVEAHDGTIGFEAAPGGGTIFWFELPVDD
jgi:signal transduction histidine kinase